MAKKPQADEGQICPLHQKDVSKVCHKCPWYTHVRGTNPQTGAEIDQWDCSISLLPMLLIENSQQTRQAGAATESFRNEMVKANAHVLPHLAAIASGGGPKLIEG